MIINKINLFIKFQYQLQLGKFQIANSIIQRHTYKKSAAMCALYKRIGLVLDFYLIIWRWFRSI